MCAARAKYRNASREDSDICDGASARRVGTTPQARFQLVNVAHWDSQADLEAAQGSGAFQDRIRALREDPQLRFSAYPAVYEIAAILTA